MVLILLYYQEKAHNLFPKALLQTPLEYGYCDITKEQIRICVLFSMHFNLSLLTLELIGLVYIRAYQHVCY